MLSITQRIVVVRGLFAALLGLVFPMSAVAHVKWFTKPESDHFVHSFTRAEIGISLVLLMSGVIVAKYLSSFCLKRSGIWSAQMTLSVLPLRVSQYLLVFYLLGCVFAGNLLVPHIEADTFIVYVGLILQCIVAVALVLKRYSGFAAFSLYLLFLVVGLIEHSFLLEYILLAGIAWIIFSGQKVPNEISITILRITLGISLIALALTEKLLQPELAFSVLLQHPLNFMQHLGFDFSDSWFVLGAGMVELFIGLLFVLGLMVRTTTLVILGLMIASNSYFFWIDNYTLAMMELIGHLPVFAVGILLLCYYGVAHTYQPYEAEQEGVLTKKETLAVESNLSTESS